MMNEWLHIVPGTKMKGHGGLPRVSRMSRGVKEGTGWDGWMGMITGASFKILLFSCGQQ